MKKRIYLDMDGVLADFVSGALEIHGQTHEQLRAAMTLGEWDLLKPMGLTLDEFWDPIHEAGEQFWIDLKPLPWFLEIIGLVVHLAGKDNWWIVTAPSRDPRSCSGKIKWLRNQFSNDFDRVIPTKDKHLLAQKNTLLIDDRTKTVQKFAKHGGDGVVFPTLHNGLYCYASDPMAHLRDLLGEKKNVRTRQGL